MKISMALIANLKIKEAQDRLRAATKIAIKNTIVDIAHDVVQGSPKKTGNNMRSIMFEVGPGGKVATEDFSAAVYGTSGYSGFLEVGHHTKSGSWVAPRPYFRPALDRNISKLPEGIKAELT